MGDGCHDCTMAPCSKAQGAAQHHQGNCSEALTRCSVLQRAYLILAHRRNYQPAPWAAATGQQAQRSKSPRMQSQELCGPGTLQRAAACLLYSCT